jgi:hypothetical protein
MILIRETLAQAPILAAIGVVGLAPAMMAMLRSARPTDGTHHSSCAQHTEQSRNAARDAPIQRRRSERGDGGEDLR